jgi:hypothetical protein
VAAPKNASPSVPFGRRSLLSVPAFLPLAGTLFIWLPMATVSIDRDSNPHWGVVDRQIPTREARVTTSSTSEDTIAECKRRFDECHTLSESTVVPEYRQALSAMAKAWMRIAQGERERQAKQQAAPALEAIMSKTNAC